MVEVFKTNVHDEEKSKVLLEKLLFHFPGIKINFDLEDFDNVLRVEGNHILPDKIMELLNREGHQCEILD
ncbi:MAG: hypothetical protein Q8891_05705 [Bacteroidota bacterium]|jgi:hypothetical protein|nr:hypothetical protein [Bacteroidota bacterium]